MSCVHYKFSSKLDYNTVTFDGLHITLSELKRQIMARERLKATDCDLQITNAQTREGTWNVIYVCIDLLNVCRAICACVYTKNTRPLNRCLTPPPRYSPLATWALVLLVFIRVHGWRGPHPQTLICDRSSYAHWRGETSWQDVHCVSIHLYSPPHIFCWRMYTFLYFHNEALCNLNGYIATVQCLDKGFVCDEYTPSGPCCPTTVWWACSDVHLSLPLFPHRDRSDTAMVGSSRPVCKPNNSVLLLSPLSSPPLFGLNHPPLSLYLENILSMMMMTDDFVCIPPVFTLSRPHLCWGLPSFVLLLIVMVAGAHQKSSVSESCLPFLSLVSLLCTHCGERNHKTWSASHRFFRWPWLY